MHTYLCRMYIIHMGIQFKYVHTYICILKYIVLIQHFANKEVGRTLLAGISTRIENYMATTAQVQQGHTYVVNKEFFRSYY